MRPLRGTVAREPCPPWKTEYFIKGASIYFCTVSTIHSYISTPLSQESDTDKPSLVKTAIMHIHGEGYVSIVELIVYIPSLILAIILCCRHGFTRASGWVYTVVLCIARIAGAICQLLTYSNDSTSLLQATLIIDSIGLSPLLLATLGMLSRS